MTDLTKLDASELADRIHSRDVSAVEVTRAHLDRIAEVDGDLHAFLHVASAQALAAANDVDAGLAAGSAPASPLAGVPLALKDVFTTTDMPTTAGSKILDGWVSPYDATLTSKLRAAGIPVLGKTNMDEFAMGSSTENSAYGPTKNPWDTTRIPGGSGGGSAAALASFQAPLAIGTDTGGSIRQPAALTGTVGTKPTYGSVSRYGLIACASSLDQGGPCGRTVLDTAFRPVVEAAREGARGDLTGVKVGVVKELHSDNYQSGVISSFDAAVAALTSLGAEVVEVSCPNFVHALAAYYLILPSEVSSNLARFDGMRYGLRAGDDGHHSAESYYGSALKVRTLIAQDFDAAYEKVDVLVSPTTPTTAFPLGDKVDDPMAMYLNDLCTLPTNLAGHCAMSVPSGLASEDGLPVGLQIMAPAFADERLYRVGAAYEVARGDLR